MSNEYLKLPLKERLARFQKEKTSCCYYTFKGRRCYTPLLKGDHDVMPLGIYPPDNRRFAFSDSPYASKDYVWVEDPQSMFVGTRTAYEIGRANGCYRGFAEHQGWYVNQFQDESTQGVVFTLPGRRGYVVGCTDPFNCDERGNGPAVIDVTSRYDTELRAARAADRIAELYAESCREDDAKQQAEHDIESLQEEATTIRDQVRHLIQAIRRSTLDPVICQRITSDLRSLIAEKHKLYERIDALRGNYWLSVER